MNRVDDNAMDILSVSYSIPYFKGLVNHFPSKRKICIAVSKEKGFWENLKNNSEKFPKTYKNKANMWSLPKHHFWPK